MKSNAPWSVKGIARDARETAKEAARREGMTVGEWLNQVIYQAGDPEESSGGEIEGLGLKDLVKAIEHLNRRLIATESKSIDAVNNLSRSVGSVVERLQRLERVKPEAGDAPALSLEFETRLARLEDSGGDRERIEALKALEKAVSQISLQFDNTHKTTLTRIEANERQLQEFASRLDETGGVAATGPMVETVDEISTRLAKIERVAEKASAFEGGQASDFDAEFVERTGKRLRVLGDEIKRCGDQIRTLEQGIHKLSEQIDGAERRSSEGVQKVSETIAELREQFSQFDARPAEDARNEIEAAVSAATQRADERIGKLQTTLDEMIARLGGDGAKGELSIDLRAEDAGAAEKDDAPADDGAFEDFEENLADGDVEAVSDQGGDEKFDPFDLDNDAELEAADAAADGDEKSEDDEEESFSFDLEADEAENEPSTAAQSVAKDILDEVRQAFSGGGSKPREREAPQKTETGPVSPEDSLEDAPDDLDAVLADLDALNEPDGAAAKTADVEKGERKTAEADRATAKAMLLGKPEEESAASPEKNLNAPSASDDYLKAARRAARETAGRAGTAALSPRGRLSPKQKAILAVQARHKHSAESADAPAEKIAQNDPAATRRAGARGDDEPAGRVAGAVAALRNKIPFLKSSAAGAPIEQENPDEDFETPKSSLSSGAKPMTIALGAAIALAAAALFFLVKDIIFGPPSPPPARKASAQTEQRSAVDMQAAVPVDPLPADPLKVERFAAPGGPTVKPDALYLDSIAAFRTAADDAAVAQAIEGLKQAAALGHPPAQLQLAEFYKLGQGVPKDLAQARSWYQRAANGGNVLAMHRLGVMTARGQGGPADADAAIGWFEQAANHGLVDSQYNLGALYHPGDDLVSSSIQDAGKAYYWYSLAARGGDNQAGELATALAGVLTPEKKQELDTAVAAWQATPNDPEANTLASPA